jgi:hypothetical protein
MALRNWSTTAANNNSAAPDGFPEGMAPSGVNNAAREVMAQVRGFYETQGWADFGDTPTRISNTQFSVPGDLTARYAANRRLKVVGATTGYATISAGAFTALTTVTVVMDSGNLPNPLTTVSLGADSTGAVQPYYRITAAEISAGVTPTNFAVEPQVGQGNRYTGLTAENFKRLSNRTLSIRDINPLAGTGSESIDTQAIIDAATQLGQIGTIYFPQNSSTSYRITPNLITFTGPIRLLGDGRNFGTSLRIVGATTGQFAFTWDTGTASRITGAGMKGFYVTSDSANGCLANLVDTNRSTFEDIWCEGLQDMFVSEMGYSNSFYNCETNNNTRYGIHLKDNHNGVQIDKCIFDGAGASGSYGVYVSGTALAVNISNCEFEGFTDVSNYGVVLSPGAGDVVGPVQIQGCAFEQVKGSGVLVLGSDYLSVQSVLIEGNSFFGSYAALFGSAAGAATYGVVLAGPGAIGVTLRRNRVADQETGFVGDQSTTGNRSVVIEENVLASGLAPYTKISGGASTVRVNDNLNTSAANVDNNQTLTGAGAVSLLSLRTYLVTTGANALTLADGVEGQEKLIVMKTDAGDGTLTPTNLYNGATLTFDDVGDSAYLVFMDSQWVFMGGTATLA